MAKREHVSETPATQLLKAHKVAYTEHPYRVPGAWRRPAQRCGAGARPVHGGQTLIMQDQDAKPLVVLMHGNRKVSTKNLARQIGAKSVEPCAPEVANRHSGYLVGARLRSAPDVTCRFTSKRAFWGCRASPSTAGAEAFWCRSTRACASSCWVRGPCSAHWQNRRRMRACPYRIYPRSCFDRRVSPFSRRGCLLAGLAVVRCHRHPGDGAQ